jgi:hypothetical protein
MAILFDMPLKEEGIPANVSVQEIIVLEGDGAAIFHQSRIKYANKPTGRSAKRPRFSRRRN